MRDDGCTKTRKLVASGAPRAKGTKFVVVELNGLKMAVGARCGCGKVGFTNKALANHAARAAHRVLWGVVYECPHDGCGYVPGVRGGKGGYRRASVIQSLHRHTVAWGIHCVHHQTSPCVVCNKLDDNKLCLADFLEGEIMQTASHTPCGWKGKGDMLPDVKDRLRSKQNFGWVVKVVTEDAAHFPRVTQDGMPLDGVIVSDAGVDATTKTALVRIRKALAAKGAAKEGEFVMVDFGVRDVVVNTSSHAVHEIEAPGSESVLTETEREEEAEAETETEMEIETETETETEEAEIPGGAAADTTIARLVPPLGPQCLTLYSSPRRKRKRGLSWGRERVAFDRTGLPSSRNLSSAIEDAESDGDDVWAVDPLDWASDDSSSSDGGEDVLVITKRAKPLVPPPPPVSLPALFASPEHDVCFVLIQDEVKRARDKIIEAERVAAEMAVLEANAVLETLTRKVKMSRTAGTATMRSCLEDQEPASLLKASILPHKYERRREWKTRLILRQESVRSLSVSPRVFNEPLFASSASE
jgi:hypothetical protein